MGGGGEENKKFDEQYDGNCPNHADVLRRVRALEYRVTDLEKKATSREVCDAETKIEIKNLSNEFASLKTDVLSTVKDHTDKTWGLINRGIKVIIALIIVILVVVGIKVGPDLIKLLFAI